MAKEPRLSWDMDLGPLQVGHRIVGAWFKSASAATGLLPRLILGKLRLHDTEVLLESI